MARSHASLAAENAVLRHQLSVLQRERPRPCLGPVDRVLWIWLCRHWSRWRSSLVLIQPETVLRWHREGYRRHWRRRFGGLAGRPRIPRNHINLIRRISSDHPEWGEDRIALELKVELGVKQRIREATPSGSVPRFLVHDNDGIFGPFGGRRPGRSGSLYRSALDLWLGEGPAPSAGLSPR